MLAPEPKLSKERILAALTDLNQGLVQRGVIGELCIFGGAAMVLAFDARQATRDVDAVFVPKSEITAAAEDVAARLDLPATWLNDGVKGFVSATGDLTAEAMPQWSNLRILRPSTAYLLAMKCLASRVGDYSGTGDREDVIRLCRELGLRDASAVLEIVVQYYPEAMIPAKTRYFVEEIMEVIRLES